MSWHRLPQEQDIILECIKSVSKAYKNWNADSKKKWKRVGRSEVCPYCATQTFPELTTSGCLPWFLSIKKQLQISCTIYGKTVVGLAKDNPRDCLLQLTKAKFKVQSIIAFSWFIFKDNRDVDNFRQVCLFQHFGRHCFPAEDHYLWFWLKAKCFLSIIK